jgi:hypothetical protein
LYGVATTQAPGQGQGKHKIVILTMATPKIKKFLSFYQINFNNFGTYL